MFEPEKVFLKILLNPILHLDCFSTITPDFFTPKIDFYYNPIKSNPNYIANLEII